MTFFHTKDIIQAYFLSALLHKKAVDIKQEDHRKKSDDDSAQTHDHAYILIAIQLLQSLICSQEPDYIEHGDYAYGSQHIRQIELSILLYVIQGQLQRVFPTH